MPTTTIRVEGLRQLGENMRGLSKKMAKNVARRATGKSANVIKRRAVLTIETNPSVDTGLLKKNVIVKRKGRTKLTSEHNVTIRPVPYPGTGRKGEFRHTGTVAHFLEFGTVKMAAEPFMRPAFDTGASEALTVMVDELRRGIDDATKGLPK